MWQLFLSPLLVCSPLALRLPAAELPPTLGKELGHAEFLNQSRTDDYRVDPYIAAAAKLREVGKDRAAAILLELAGGRECANAAIVLSRMLFVARPKSEFRRPLLGLPCCVGGTSAGDWPLEPMAVVDGVPFLVVRGYNLFGSAEAPLRYVRYCIRECDWGNADLKPKSAVEKRKALEKLLASPVWKKPLSNADREFLANQIK
jgi:hypothetical protein